MLSFRCPCGYLRSRQNNLFPAPRVSCAPESDSCFVFFFGYADSDSDYVMLRSVDKYMWTMKSRVKLCLCICCMYDDAMDVKTRSKKRKRTAPPAVSVPLLPEEIVMEILARLPVKSLLRFKSVCRGWCAMMSEPSFIRTQLQCSASRRKQEPSILISPHIGHDPHAISLQDDWPSKLSTHISFYQWEHGGASSLARLMDARDFPAGEFRLICYFTHCDGLVLAPTNTKLYLFNPATREAITLPDGHGNDHAAGLGLDPGTGKYKVVWSFYRSMDPISMGMEVFTIGELNACWRETATDPPHPVTRWRTALAVKGGYLFWYMDRRRYPDAPRGLLRFSLQDEAFTVTRLPDSLDPALDENVLPDVLHGELCVIYLLVNYGVLIWTMMDDGAYHDYGPWELRYCISVSALCLPMGRSHYPSLRLLS